MPRTSSERAADGGDHHVLGGEEDVGVGSGRSANVAMGWLPPGAPRSRGTRGMLLTVQPYRDIVALSTNSSSRPEGGSIQAMTVTEPATRPLSAHDPRLAPWRAFLLAHARVARRLDEELRAEHDLSFAEYDALLTIAQAPGRRIRMGQLADEVVLSKSGVTRLIDRLVARRARRAQRLPDRRARRRGGPDRARAAPPARGIADPPARDQPSTSSTSSTTPTSPSSSGR